MKVNTSDLMSDLMLMSDLTVGDGGGGGGRWRLTVGDGDGGG